MNWFTSKIPLSLYLITLTLLVASCDNDPEPRTRLLFNTGNTLTTADRSVPAGEIITTSVFAEAPAGKSLTKFTIQYAYKGSEATTYLDSTFIANQFAMVFTFGTRGIAGEETWIFNLTDSDNQITSRQFTLKTTASAQPFPTYASIFYKKSARENLRFFSVAEGNVYPGYLVRNDPKVKEKVTFQFDVDPLHETRIKVIGENGTTLKPTTLPNTDNIKTAADIRNLYNNSGPEDSKISNIAKPQIIAFKTALDKTGVIRIIGLDTLLDATTNKYVLMRARYEVKMER